MALELRQNLKMTHQLLMTPQLQQAIKLLQLSRTDLEEYVSQQIAENPLLEEKLDTPLEGDHPEITPEQFVNFELEDAGLPDKISDQSDFDTPKDWQKAHNHQSIDGFENYFAHQSTLFEYLIQQIREIRFSEEEQKIAMLIIGHLDEKGFFPYSLEEFCKEEHLDEDLSEGVLDTLQRFDPPGVCARDLKECLLIQVREKKIKDPLIKEIIQSYLPEVQNYHDVYIAKQMGQKSELIRKAIEIIQSLDPNPARNFGYAIAQPIIPDVYIFKVGKKWNISLNEEGLPFLRINQSLIEKSSIRNQKDKEYIQEKIRSAQWLIKSIQQRQKTILKVTEAILERQINFFEKGLEHLKPMILKDVAKDIKMHESTISRVTNQKYVHTPMGVFELKYFFSSSVCTADGDDIASESVKRMIRQMIDLENEKKPFSDQKIVENLKNKGVQLARRTVAKYRDQLGILPSSKRKKMY